MVSAFWFDLRVNRFTSEGKTLCHFLNRQNKEEKNPDAGDPWALFRREGFHEMGIVDSSLLS